MPPPPRSGDSPDAGRARPWRAADLVDVWEHGREQAPPTRALTLLASAFPGVDAETLADLPIGERDALLLHLRALTFGPTADCIAHCPACYTPIEFTVPLRELQVDAPASAEGEIQWLEGRLRVRAATTRDQLAVAGLADRESIVGGLLQRCAAVVTASEGTPSPVPADAIEAVAAEMARLDPGADLRFTLACPACAASWTSPFDVGAYLWNEVDTAARGLLSEVHALASAYGWSESAILGLGTARRRAYLELTGSR